MAKHESTAVNELINLVSGEQRLPKEDDDLMFRAPSAPAPAPKTINPPRMSSQLPSMRGSGEVAPLPRGRAPSGTQQNLPSLPPAVRMMTAPPSRSTTIPPLSKGSSSQIATESKPALPMALRSTRPSLPPPTPTRPSSPRAEGTPAPELFSRSPNLASPPTLPPPTLPTPAVARTVAPPTMPVAAPFEPRPAPRDSHPFAAIPISQAPVDMTSHEPWFEPSGGVERLEQADEPWIGTVQVAKPIETKSLIAKLVVPMIGLVVAGVFVGGFVAFSGQGGKHHVVADETKVVAPEPQVAPTPVAAVAPVAAIDPAPAVTAPAPAPEPPVAAAPTPAEPAPVAVAPTPAEPAPVAPPPVAHVEPAPVAAPVAAQSKLVDIRIDSKPSGATVMLVDHGRTSFLGTTPMSAAMDPSRGYDVVFTYANRPTQVEHLDPKTTTHLAITLGKQGNQAIQAMPATKAPPPAKAEHQTMVEPKHAVAAAPKAAPTPIEKKAVEPKVTEPTEPVEKKVAVAEPAGNGTLMISSKPPCEIYIDGKPTGLSTPQRSLPLSAGSHKITLVNTSQNLKKTVAVQITADKPTKLIQDLMK